MKHIYIISLGGLILLMGMFFIVVTIQSNNHFKFKKTAREMLLDVTTPDHYISFDQVRESLNSPGKYKLIDLRTPKEFVGSHIEGAINIPFDRILDEAHEPIFKEDLPKILYGESPVTANAAWMVLTQYGYENLSVLNGGISAWMNSSKSEDTLGNTGIRDEISNFDYAELLDDN